MRQRLLFIVLLVVVVLVGYTILRPKPKAKAKVSREEKSTTAVIKPAPTKPEVVPPVTKAETKADTAASAELDTKAEPVRPKPIPTKPDTTELEVSKKTDTTKPVVIQKPVTQPIPEEKVVKWGTDPFIRDWVLATEIKDMRLKAVTISGIKAYALINDQILERGEVIMGKRIVAIEKDKVILEQGGRQFTLFLGE